MEEPAEVPVGGVDEPHGGDPTTGSGRRPDARSGGPRGRRRDTIGASAYLPSLQVTHHRRAAVRQTALACRAPSRARGVQRRHPAPLRGGPRCRRGRARAVPGRRADRRGRAAEPGAARDRAGARAAGRRDALRGHLPAPRRAHPRRRPRAARRPLPHGRGQVGDAAQGVPPPGHRHPGLGHGGRRRAARRAQRRRHRHRLRVPRRGRLPRPAARDPRRRPGAPAHVAHPRVGAGLQRAARRPAAGDPHRRPVPAAVRVPVRRLLRRAGGQDALRPRRGARRRTAPAPCRRTPRSDGSIRRRRRSSPRCRTRATTSTSRRCSSPCPCGPARARSSRSCSSGRATSRSGPASCATASSSTPAARLPCARAAEALLEALGDQGPIFVYHDFEKWRIMEMAAMLPDLAPALNAVAGRLVDLLRLTRDHYQHPALGRLVLAQDGAADGGRRARPRPARGGPGRPLRAGGLPRGRRPGHRRPTAARRCAHSLLEYCGLDTLALVRVAHRFAAVDAPS